MVITEQRREKRAEGEERRGGEEYRAEWAQREQQWKKALICTSDFCKLVYHVSSVTDTCLLPLPLLAFTQPKPSCFYPDTFMYSLGWIFLSSTLFLCFFFLWQIWCHTYKPISCLLPYYGPRFLNPFHLLTYCWGCMWRVDVFYSPLGLIEQLGL